MEVTCKIPVTLAIEFLRGSGFFSGRLGFMWVLRAMYKDKIRRYDWGLRVLFCD